MNRVIRFLMISDIFLLTSFGLINPVLAIFFKEDLIGGSIVMAGLASTVFLVTKSFVQLPFSRYVDSHTYGTRVRWLITGSFLLAIVPFIYVIAKQISTIFFAQALQGIASGLVYPTWLGLWSTHLDKKRESFEWSLYSTMTGLGTAATAAIGALLANFVGFKPTFLFVGILSLGGCTILFNLDRHRNKTERLMGLNYHKRRKLIGGMHRV